MKIPLPIVPGSDISGVVEEIGDMVSGIKKGDKVILFPGVSCGECKYCLAGGDNMCPDYELLGYRRDGGYAEYVKVPSANIVPMPAGLNFVDAASVPLVFVTAWHMLVTRAKVQPGEDVLVLAAGSGVGIAAIQVAKLFGARVIATASTEEKLAKAHGLGADDVINYTKKDFHAEIMKMTNKKGVEIVVEHIGPATWEKSIMSLARNGRLVTCGATTGPTVKLDLRYIFSRQLSVLGSYMGSKAELLEVTKYFPDKKLQPVVDRVLALKDVKVAHKLLEDRKQFGKVVLTPTASSRS
jgi:NADPH:quinone reductase-like Zn-dependent oxidoreductase